MEILETNKNSNVEKSFNNSLVTLANRATLTITGVEKTYEATATRVMLKVSGSNMIICGENLNITKLDVEAGNIQIEGKINEIKYNSDNKGLFKRLFK